MKVKSIVSALLLMLAAWQTAQAQGFRVYLSDGTFVQYSLRTDSIVFYDGIGEEVDYNPFAPNNKAILGNWYTEDGHELYFNSDGSTNFDAGHYKYMPNVGSLVIYDSKGTPTRVLRVADLTSDTLLLASGSSESIRLYTRTKPDIINPIEMSCSQAVELVNGMADGAISAEVYSITGYITQVIGSVIEWQQSFKMADTKDGDITIEANWAILPSLIDNFTVGSKVTITGQLIKYVKDGVVTARIKDARVTILELGDRGVVRDNPFNVADAIAYIKTLGADVTSNIPIYTKGIICEVIRMGTRGSIQFKMSDNGQSDNALLVYYCNNLGDEPFNALTDLKVGDEVIVCGRVVNYKGNTPEYASGAYLVSLDGKSGDGNTKYVTCAEAVRLVNALADGCTSTETYTITGYITEVYSSISRGQQSFWMADAKDGGKVFEAYWANLPEGVETFTAGMKVTIKGQLLKYVKNDDVISEMKNATVVILETGEESDGGYEANVTGLISNGGFEVWMSDSEPEGWKPECTARTATLSKSTDARTGKYACCIAASGTANKRLATKEIKLDAGIYRMSFYAKSTTADVCQTRPGYVPVTDNVVGSYVFGEYVNLTNTLWTLVEYEFSLESASTVCLVIMNPKNSNYSTSQDILIDDFTLEKK